MALYEALYGRKCRTLLYWTKLSEKKIHEVDLVRETEKKVKVIQDSLKAASDRQKSYADLKRKEIEFQVGDNVFLKVSPWKKVLRFGRKGKLSPRLIGPYEIIERIRLVSYRLALPLELDRIHNNESGKEYVVFNDASLSGLGCVLMQAGKVIACAS
ncbi:DNA/RNA polymerases superfamily protein [Gossypium australe]|uniref:DNA/RNA polymerases superfamily protein n=1 Tax=Gossypium australe TaxID=47621 RepID=A0A5B6WSZ0_9ROSI|nr:DNA/RNA polymerases superfamily protein [Gossypium australe]